MSRKDLLLRVQHNIPRSDGTAKAEFERIERILIADERTLRSRIRLIAAWVLALVFIIALAYLLHPDGLDGTTKVLMFFAGMFCVLAIVIILIDTDEISMKASFQIQGAPAIFSAQTLRRISVIFDAGTSDT